MKNIFISLLLFLIFVAGCKQKNDNSIKDDTKNRITTSVKKRDIKKSLDSIFVKKFVKAFINDVKSENIVGLSEKFRYPIEMFEFEFKSKEEFIKQWKLNSKLKEYLSLKKYNENDEYNGDSTVKNTTIHYFIDSETGDSTAQFGLGSGLIFDIKRIENHLIIIKIDVAG